MWALNHNEFDPPDLAQENLALNQAAEYDSSPCSTHVRLACGAMATTQHTKVRKTGKEATENPYKAKQNQREKMKMVNTPNSRIGNTLTSSMVSAIVVKPEFSNFSTMELIYS